MIYVWESNMIQQQSGLTIMILFVVSVSFACATLLITELESEPDVCDLVKRTDDCLFTLKGK